MKYANKKSKKRESRTRQFIKKKKKRMCRKTFKIYVIMLLFFLLKNIKPQIEMQKNMRNHQIDFWAEESLGFIFYHILWKPFKFHIFLITFWFMVVWLWLFDLSGWLFLFNIFLNLFMHHWLLYDSRNREFSNSWEFEPSLKVFMAISMHFF